MKTRLIIITVLSLFTVCLQAEDDKDKKIVKSKLDEATVFFQGAELTHSASLALPKGESEIWIEGLSPNIDKNSLKIKATRGVVISSSEFSVDFLSGTKDNPAARRLQDSIDFYNNKLNELEIEINIVDELKGLLRKGTDKNVSGSEKGLGIDELVKTMEYYKSKSNELENTQAANEKRKEKLNQSISRLKKQQNQESLKNNKTSGVLKLILTSPAATTSNFTISYYTGSAAWVPFYDINIESTDKPIKIGGKAKVRQTTGLDWDKVKLALSTAMPSNGKIAPLFSTWFLENVSRFSNSVSGLGVATQNSYSYDRYEMAEIQKEEASPKMLVRGASSVVNNAKPLYVVNGELADESYVQSLDPSMIESVNVLKDASATSLYGSKAASGVVVITTKSSMEDYVSVADNQINITYNIDMPFSVPGNGKEQSLDLQTRETQAEYKYYCAPKLDTETYLLAEIPDWQNLGLLSGRGNITYDGTYVGETLIDANSTHDKLSLTLGTDKRVAVKREKMQDYSSTKFLGNDVKQVFTYKLTVKNNQTKPVKMVLKDQYPRSTQKSIEVELLKETTQWTANKEETGVITWEETLQPGETKVYQLSYSVKYPKGLNLNL